MCVCLCYFSDYLFNFYLFLRVFIFEWKKVSVFVTQEEGSIGKKNSHRITDKVQIGCESLVGKRSPWTGCVNDWRRSLKEYMQLLLTLFGFTPYVEQEQQEQPLLVCVCLCEREKSTDAGNVLWFLTDPYWGSCCWMSLLCLFVYLCVRAAAAAAEKNLGNSGQE